METTTSLQGLGVYGFGSLEFRVLGSGLGVSGLGYWV